MPKVFITGPGGVGKSTIIKQLQERGFIAYDTDDIPEATRLENTSGSPVDWPEGHVDWNVYRWNWQRPVIERLLSSNNTVFLGAIPSNWRDFVKDFDSIIALTIDSKTHEHRLKTRNTHEHGQGEQNIADNIYSKAVMIKNLVSAGAIVLENDRPVDEVVDEIIARLHVNR